MTDRLPKWELGIGAIGLNLPDYPGSSNNRFRGAGFPFYIYRGDRLRADDEGTRARLVSSKYHELGISFGFNFPVNSNDNPSRLGMPNLDALFSVGPRLLMRLLDTSGNHRLNFTLATRAVFSSKLSFNNLARAEGAIFEPKISYWYRWQNSVTTLFSSVALEFGTSKYNAFFYNVAPDQTTSFRNSFQAKAGLVETSFNVGLSQQISRRLFGFTAVSLRNLEQSANNHSPLIETQNNFGAILGFIWTFYESEQLANPSKP